MDVIAGIRAVVGWGGVGGLALLALPGIFFAIARLARARPRAVAPASGTLPKLVFLVPAHNERLLVEACARSLLAQTYPRDRMRVIVLADNCDDDTAALARAVGAEVLERHNLEQRGKPHALAWAIAQVPPSDVDAFIVIDADSEVAPDYAARVAAVGDVRGGAWQTYFGISNEYETWLTRLAGLLMRLRYEIQFPAKARAGINVPLTGNGMVLGADLMRRRPWQAFSVTEDWELYAEYTARNEHIGFVPAARLLSQEARSTSQSATQRVRWQAGRREVRRRWMPEIRASRSLSLMQKIDTHVELYWPSPAVHMSLVIVSVACAVIGGIALPLVAVCAAAAVADTGLSVVAIIARHPQPGATIRALLWAPVYAVWRLGIGVRARLSRRARADWVRTARHEHR